LKKILILLLVAAMMLGSLAGIFIYAGLSGNRDENLFEDIPEPVIGSNRFLDLRGADVSMISFKEEAAIFHTFTFDTSTKWPEDESMPGWDLPGEILEKGKYLGLGLSTLAQKGITGKGVAVAVIDRPTLSEHQAFGPGFSYIEVASGHSGTGQPSLNGTAVAGLLAGRDGVAPEATLYYFAVPDGEEPYVQYAEAIHKMLELQQSLSEQDKIRVAAIAKGVEDAGVSGGAGELFDAIEKARQQGIVVIYPGMSALPVTGAGCPPDKDRDDPANYGLWSWSRARGEIAGRLESRSAASWEDAVYILKELLTCEEALDWLEAETINTFLYVAYMYKDYVDFEDWLAMTLDESQRALAVPVDYVTVPDVHGANEYTYYGSSGLSWATGYIAGLATLGVQVEPGVTEQEILELLWDTATPFKGGARLANPVGFINRLTSR